MWVLNTATAAVLIPVAITIAQRVQPPKMPSGCSKCWFWASDTAPVWRNCHRDGQRRECHCQRSACRFRLFAVDGLRTACGCMLLPISWFLLLRVFPGPNIEIDTLPAPTRNVALRSFQQRRSENYCGAGYFSSAMDQWFAIEQHFGLPKTILSSAVVAIGAVAALSVELVYD